MAEPQSKSIESVSQFEQSPAGQQERWGIEIEASEKYLEEFWKEGDTVVQEFLGKGNGTSQQKRRLNLFYSDTVTKSANMSGDPKVRAKRRFADARDDEARVSATMLERMLNMDMQRPTDGFKTALQNAKADWIRVGLGVMRHRYTAEFEQQKTEAIIGEDGEEKAPAVNREVKKHEDVETEWVYWRDFGWSPCRIWEEVRFIFFKLLLSRDACVKQWGEEIGKRIPLRNRDQKRKEDKDNDDPWARAEVYEIWDKDSRKVVFFAKGMAEIIQSKDDPLGLAGFFPCAKPLMANVTTTDMIPKATYWLAKDLYDEAHALTRRIRGLVQCIKATGVYDRADEGIKRLFQEATENELIPVDNWSKLVEKGGLVKSFEILDITPYVAAVVQLVQQRNLVKQEIYEITGQSDIMRGQAAQKATATEQRIKARFGAGRIQAEQEELARFASENQSVRAEIWSKLGDAETIIKRSNIEAAETIVQPPPPQPPPMPGMPPAPPPPPQRVPNTELIQKAVELLKSDIGGYRIVVDSDSLGMADFDAIQQEGTAILSATAEFFGKVMPVAATDPKIAKFFLEMYQASISQFRGAERYESIIDRFVDELEQAAQAPKPPPPPDPQVQTAQIKAGAEQFKAKADVQKTAMDLQVKTAEHQMDMQKAAVDAEAQRQSFGMRMAEVQAQRAMMADTGMPPPAGTPT